jgi:hypothetical protein
MLTKYRYEIAFPAELVQASQHFASGVNDAGEARGLALSGRHLGITCSDIRRGLLEELEIYTHGLLEVFVDSGAFSEVDFPEDGPPVVARPISDAQWIERLGIAHRVARTYGRRALIVAPDRVGCQATTLERLARYAPHVAAIASTGARIIVPVQKGAMPMSAMFARACEILGLREAPIAGVPMKKDATTLADLRELVQSLPWFGARIHLLGLGPKSKHRRFEKAVALIRSINPNCSITSDSTQAVRGEVGRTNGRENVAGERKGGPRRLTSAQDRARARGLKGSDVKANALIATGLEEAELELEAAISAGWFDVELFDTIEEARADLEERKARRAPKFDQEAAA